MQALYQWQLNPDEMLEIEVQFRTEQDMSRVDVDYFHDLLHGVADHVRELDEVLAPLLSRPLGEVDPVERAILRIGAFEMAHRPDIPYRVVIDEAVGLARTFGAEQGHRFVNGILDRLATRLRSGEARARRPG